MNEKIKASRWVRLLRFVAYAQIVLGCLLSLVLGVAVMVGGTEVSYASGVSAVTGGSVAVGLVIIVVGVFFSFLSAALTMVLLGAAEDIHVIRVLTERKQ